MIVKHVYLFCPFFHCKLTHTHTKSNVVKISSGHSVKFHFLFESVRTHLPNSSILRCTSVSLYVSILYKSTGLVVDLGG